ncbi:S-adenosyl-L-methionine-dependent methyltransferase [Meira miltonrushii]|uniref:S-adenosyl-L-methionine-dependent methyltransferase n=1 Tax=Meira miltonrushii TaxID=1280837 RepID=A0A316VF84_9BASI|nr:S-adenosyl-L-methionine-dependent methyltransferase [Meira miltonrushii]PWN36242.1 S-adenosyl-L-methionine-dependent methyltransferase [Meira miltonrushii]
MNIGKIANNGSSLFQSIIPRPIWNTRSQINFSRAFSQTEKRSKADAIQKQRLGKVLKNLVEFHKSQVAINQESRAIALREAEEQAFREYNWLMEEVKLDTTKKYETRKTEKVIELAQRLSNGEPLSYVLGNQPFGPLLIKCMPPTLIPRPETEALTEYIFEQLRDAFREHIHRQEGQMRPLRILDLCTGSGCISLLIRHRLLELISKETSSQSQSPAFQILGVDIADSALQLARKNLALYDTDADHGDLVSQYGHLVPVSFERGDMLDESKFCDFIAQHGPFDVVLCNPPYIPAKEWKELDASVREWEDRLALVGHPDNESDGLLFYRRLAQSIEIHELLALSKNGQLPLVAMEVGHDQAEKVREIFAGQKKVPQLEIWTDLFDKQRAVIAKM